MREPRYAPTGVVSAGPSLDRHDGGNSTGRDQTTTPIGRAPVPKTDHQEAGIGHRPRPRPADPQPPRKRASMTDPYEAHCRRSGCTCGHTYCYRGWIDTDRETRPCGQCRANTYERWLKREEARQKGYPTESLGVIMRTPINR